MEKQRGVRKTRIGKVVSDKMDKTVVVEVKRLVAHPLYHKIIRRRVKIKAHVYLLNKKNAGGTYKHLLLLFC